ncbi:MAG: hypothetical protein KAS71_11255 [Bacteroidales bacterium]|nr:hypothetical protein [Bacteroidales bacterium]
MVRKVKVNKLNSPKEIKDYVEELKSSSGNEIPLSIITKLFEKLGATFDGYNKGSMAQFSHPKLAGFWGFQNGVFSIHYAHGKDPKQVYKLNFKRHVYPIIIQLIKINNIK